MRPWERAAEWIGPFRIEELLDRMVEKASEKPPESDEVYVVSEKSWRDRPGIECVPLYVGSNTGKSPRFRTRIGDLMADMFGFFGQQRGHHSGGQTLYKYCVTKGLNPKHLYIAWSRNCLCVRCEETRLYHLFRSSLLNKKEPPGCNKHRARAFG